MPPTVESIAENSTNTAGTSHVLNMPSSVAAGNLLLIILGKGSTAATINSHADWTELLDENSGNGLYIAWRIAAGGETSTTLTSSANTRTASIVYRIASADTANHQVSGSTASGSGTTPDPPSLTATGGIARDILWFACFSRDGEEADDDTWTTAAPSGYSVLTQKACGTAGTALGGMIASAHKAANSSLENPGTFTCATGAWRAQTIAIWPAPVTAPHRPKLFNYSDDAAVVRASRW